MTGPRPAVSRRALLGAALSLPLAMTALSSAWAAGGARIRKLYGECRWGQVHFWGSTPDTKAAASKPALVLFHQSPASGDNYREFQAVMAPGRPVLAVDTPGFGRSDKPPEAPDIAGYAGAVVEALESLGYGAKKKIDLLAFHTGCFIAVEIALTRPDLVRRLILGGIPLWPAGERDAKRQELTAHRLAFDDAQALGKAYDDAVVKRQNGQTLWRRLDNFIDRMRAGPDSWWAFDALLKYDADRALAALTQPVLVPVLNETLAQNTRHGALLIKKATVVELPDLNVFAWQLTPQALADVINPFLDN